MIQFYSFSAEIDAIESISAFTVQINLVGGSSETHDNHGTNYPMSDHIMLQIPQSCIALTPDVNGNKALTVVAAVCGDQTFIEITDSHRYAIHCRRPI